MLLSKRILLILISCYLSFGVPLSYSDECEGTWLRGTELPGATFNTNSPNGRVCTSLEWDMDGAGPLRSLVIFGGSFTHAGSVYNARNIVGWDSYSNSWKKFGNGLGQSDTVHSLAVFNNELYACGTFFGALSRIAKWNGTEWVAVGSGLNGTARALAVYNNELIVGGSFTSAGGNPASNIARWNGTSWQALGSGTDNVVYTLCTYGGNLIVGGAFTVAGGQSIYAIASWNGSAWQDLGGGVTITPLAMVTYAGKLIVTGVNGGSGYLASKIAQWNGTSWSSMGTGLDGDGYALTVWNNKLVAGGVFDTAGGIPAKYLAAWDDTAWSPIPQSETIKPPENTTTDVILHLGIAGNELVAGGRFLQISNFTTASVAIWNGATWRPPSGGLAIDPTTNSLATYENKLFLGGVNQSEDQLICNDTKTWTFLETGKRSRHTSDTWCAQEYAGDLIVAGKLYQTANVPIYRHLGQWNGINWTEIGEPVNSNGSIYAMTIFNGELIVAGRFTMMGGVTTMSIARWDGATWRALGGGLSFSSEVYALEVFNDKLVVGGYGLTGGGATNSLAQWDGNSWSTLSSGVFSGVVKSLAVHSGKLYVGGAFFGSLPIQNVACWDGFIWSSLNGGLNQSVQCMASYNGKLYVGGSFSATADEGISLASVGAWNDVTWASTGAIDGLPISEPYSMIVFNRELVVLGSVATQANYTNGISRWFTCSACPADLNNDGVVDDQDFSIFIIQYDLFDCEYYKMLSHCPGDLNRDGIVNDDDFSIFTIAYGEFLCSP